MDSMLFKKIYFFLNVLIGLLFVSRVELEYSYGNSDGWKELVHQKRLLSLPFLWKSS